MLSIGVEYDTTVIAVAFPGATHGIWAAHERYHFLSSEIVANARPLKHNLS